MYETKQEFIDMLKYEIGIRRERGTPEVAAVNLTIVDVLWQYDQFFLDISKRLNALEEKKP